MATWSSASPASPVSCDCRSASASMASASPGGAPASLKAGGGEGGGGGPRDRGAGARGGVAPAGGEPPPHRRCVDPAHLGRRGRCQRKEGPKGREQVRRLFVASRHVGVRDLL